MSITRAVCEWIKSSPSSELPFLHVSVLLLEMHLGFLGSALMRAT